MLLVTYFTHWNTHHSSLISWKLFEANRLGATSSRKYVIANPQVLVCEIPLCAQAMACYLNCVFIGVVFWVCYNSIHLKVLMFLNSFCIKYLQSGLMSFFNAAILWHVHNSHEIIEFKRPATMEHIVSCSQTMTFEVQYVYLSTNFRAMLLMPRSNLYTALMYCSHCRWAEREFYEAFSWVIIIYVYLISSLYNLNNVAYNTNSHTPKQGKVA